MDQLVVVLNKCDSIAEFLPYVADLARPGMTISFLVHYASGEFQEVMDQLLAAPDRLVSDHDADRGDGAKIDALNEDDLAALRRLGVDFKVSVYSGSARRALRQFVSEQPEGLLVMRGGARCAMTRALRRARWLARLFNWHSRGPSVVLARNL